MDGVPFGSCVLVLRFKRDVVQDPLSLKGGVRVWGVGSIKPCAGLDRDIVLFSRIQPARGGV